MAPPHFCADLHMNQDNCVINVFEIFRDGWIEGVKMYSPIFIIPALLFGKRGYVVYSFVDLLSLLKKKQHQIIFPIKQILNQV